MASKSKRQKSSESYRMMYGTCPDDGCQAKLYFPSYDKSIECTNCGQRHERSALKSVAEVTNSGVAVHNLLKNILLGNVKPKKGADNVKVLGLSNYVCKLISPILTYYGVDRESGKAKTLIAMGKGEIFDVNILGDRAFLIEEEHLGVNGYGRDRSGSLSYLSDTLHDIRMVNDKKENLVPIHADGDGHCLVHAISRCLVGRELFWHALRINLKAHLITNLDKYKLLFRDFVDQDEWEDIIDECDPYYLPPEGEALGMRNIHIFGLANVLHRPIILLDSKSGMNSSGDYSGVFLPGLVAAEKCRGKDGSLNKPLVIAWSSSGRNHYIPIVPVKGLGPARLPKFMVQKAWGMPRETIHEYLEFDSKYCCIVGGDKCLTDRYLRQLVGTMEEVFVEKYEVSPLLVADVHQYIYKAAGIVGMLPNEVIERTQTSVGDRKLFRCLMCEALTEYALSRDQFDKGGSLYKLAVSVHKKLDPTKHYSFPAEGAVCSYNEKEDRLVLDTERSRPKTCAFCQGETLRQVKADGTVLYIDGDRTTTPCIGGKCPCGFKHFWNGKEYDNIPEIFPITLQWAGKVVTEKIPWFQYESDATLNSNVFEVAQALVQKHFPGEFGSERLVQRVVDSILDQSARALKDTSQDDNKPDVFGDSMDAWAADTASKIILTGQKKKTIHKEELMKSEKEKNIRKKIASNAPKVQQKKTQELLAKKSPQRLPVQKQPDTKGLMSKSSHVPVASSEPKAGTSSASDVVQSPSKEKKIRLQTSDGRQAMLTLVKDITYAELQKLICQTVDVPAERQKIRLGFPPKVLEPPGEEEKEKPVDIHHGDKLALEVLPDPSQTQMTQSYPPTTSSRQVASWGSFEEETQDQNAERLLQALKDIQHTAGGDSIDTSVASLRIISELAGKDLWTYVQSMPHLFSVGGLLYNQVKRDLGLVDKKHCQLPCLPGKVFRYNSSQDRLELCLEPYGHYPVEPNIEQKVKDSGLEPEPSTSKDEVKFGASGAIHHGQERKAFSGQGHSLTGADDRMPADLACANHKPQARGFHDLCPVPGKRKDSIPEEPEEAMEETGEEKEETKYQRLGPGYSVLDPGTVNNQNANLEMFRALAESIEKTLSQHMEQDSQDEADITDEHIPSGSVSNSNVVINESVSVDMVSNTDDVNKDKKLMETDQTTIMATDALQNVKEQELGDPQTMTMATEALETVKEQDQIVDTKMDVETDNADCDRKPASDTSSNIYDLKEKSLAVETRDVIEMDTETVADRSALTQVDSESVSDNVLKGHVHNVQESVKDNPEVKDEEDSVMVSANQDTNDSSDGNKIVESINCDNDKKSAVQETELKGNEFGDTINVNAEGIVGGSNEFDDEGNCLKSEESNINIIQEDTEEGTENENSPGNEQSALNNETEQSSK